MERYPALAVLLLHAMVAPAFAQQVLSGAEIKTLITDRTVVSTVHDRNIRFRNYFASDGLVVGVRDSGGTIFEGKWFVNDSGHLCTTFKVQGHLCTRVVRMSDGSHQRIDGDKLMSTFHQIENGNRVK